MTDRYQPAVRYAALLFPLLLLACLADAARSNDLLHQLKQEITDGTYGTIDGLLISQNGDLIVEEYYNGWWASRAHWLASTTKSVTSALVGIAIESGTIDGVETSMLDFFPDYTPANPDARKEAITLGDMLKMQAGFRWDELSVNYGSPGNSWYDMRFSGRDWTEYVLDLEMSAAPGDEFTYNSGVALLLSKVLSQSVGTTAAAFAAETLFADLDIGPVVSWRSTPQGDTNTAGGLSLRPLDMLKFGQLYLNDGYWQPDDEVSGKQVVPSQWVAESTRPYIREGMLGSDEVAPFNYGYQWWRFGDDDEVVSELAVNDVYFSWGYAGQFIFVVPDLDLVVVSTADNSEGHGFGDEFFPALSRFIFPAIQERNKATEVSAVYIAIDDGSGSGFDDLGDITVDKLSKVGSFVGEVDAQDINQMGRLVAKFPLPEIDEASRMLESATLRFFLIELDGTPAGPVSIFHGVADNDEDLLASDYENTSYVDTQLDLVGPADQPGRYYELDVTDLVLSDYAADGDDLLSAFRLQISGATFTEDNQSARYRFAMPEDYLNRPELVLTFIPEPSTLLLSAIAMLGLVARGWRRKASRSLV